MVVVIGGCELWPLLMGRRAGKPIHLIIVSVNQPALVAVDVLEGRQEHRQQQREARLYGRDTTHSVIDCS